MTSIITTSPPHLFLSCLPVCVCPPFRRCSSSLSQMAPLSLCLAVSLSLPPPSLSSLSFPLSFSPSASLSRKLEIMDENTFEREPGTARVSQNYVKQALPSLMPVVLETLSKQDEDSADDLEHWDLGECGVVRLRCGGRAQRSGRQGRQGESGASKLWNSVVCSVEFYGLH